MAERDRIRARPTARGVALLLLGLALVLGAYWERQALMLVPAALCLGVVVLGAAWSLAPGGSIRMGLPPVTQEGRRSELRLAGGARRAGGRWQTWGPGEGRWLQLEGELDEQGAAAIDLGAQPRGRWPLAAVELTTHDPFGAVRTVRRVDPGASLVVGPDVVRVDRASLRANRDEGRTAQSRTADAVDAMVREWRPGDPQRRVHWRQTAKRGRRMVRQEANPAVDDDLVIVDTARAAGLERDAHDRLARAACSLAVALAGADRRVRVLETGAPSMPEADWRDLPSALAAFADMEPDAPGRPPEPEARAAHVVALEEAAPEAWTLPPGSTLWLVAERTAPPRAVASGSRVRVVRWIDRLGPAREL